MKTNELKLRSGLTSVFDVQRWAFDVRRSSLKTTLYGINVTCVCLLNNLALIEGIPGRCRLSAAETLRGFDVNLILVATANRFNFNQRLFYIFWYPAAHLGLR
ncbi:MAG: hypothetical protein WCB15_15135, partial [Desulfobacterales bacterium]